MSMGCKTPFLVLLREENYGDLVSFVRTCELINLLLGWSGEKKRGVIFLSQNRFNHHNLKLHFSLQFKSLNTNSNIQQQILDQSMAASAGNSSSTETVNSCLELISSSNPLDDLFDQSDYESEPTTPDTIRQKAVRSKYRGVRPRPWGKWTGEIKNPNKNTAQVWLGTFDMPEDAGSAYGPAPFQIHGQNAELNFPQTRESHEEKHFRGAKGRFAAEIRDPKNGARLCLGTYDAPEGATLPYDRASYKMRVARAVLNFPHLLDSNTCEFLLRYQNDQMHIIQVDFFHD
ncbi:hypothetical protein CUMW_148100 [Citrus unshiu]|uniref:AP2/ERF domain-containing protein n=1 Tax=Citrus unshiu TaxID=55188 RepID=A0A2H5PLR7_CITUN|nr:hypothetical protein CUMW_148100 [Citrus unshiu]